MAQRVLLITADSTPTGAPRQVALLAKGLAMAGVDVHVVCPPGWLTTELEKSGATIHLLTESTALNVQRTRLREIITLVQPHIVHSHGVRGGLWGRLASNPSEQKVVYTEHLWTRNFHLSNVYRERLQLASLRWLDRRTHHTVAVSDATADFLLEHKITNQKKLTTIPGAVEAHPIQKLVTEPVIGTIGTLSQVKGVDILLEAAATLLVDIPQLKVAIGGDGPERANLEALAASLGLTERVHWLGATADTTFFSRLRVYVQASRSESFGIAPLEAMMRGIPVVLSNRGALPALLSDASQGTITELSAPKLAEAIKELLLQKDLTEMGKAAHARALYFNPKAFVDAHLALYESLTR